MSDLIERLRREAWDLCADAQGVSLMHQASDEIDRLRAELDTASAKYQHVLKERDDARAELEEANGKLAEWGGSDNYQLAVRVDKLDSENQRLTKEVETQQKAANHWFSEANKEHNRAEKAVELCREVVKHDEHTTAIEWGQWFDRLEEIEKGGK